MADTLDALETRDPQQREAALMAALPGQIALAKEKAPGLAKHLAEVDPRAVNDRRSLAGLPVLRKSDLLDAQGEAPPFGGLAAVASGQMTHLFASPGPIYEFETGRSGFWRTARALYAAGFRRSDIVHNSFSYHLTPGGWIMDGGARSLGCTVIPAGIGNTEQQVAAMAHFRPAGFIGTPDYLKVLLEKAKEMGADVSSLDKALVSGGALFPELRSYYGERGIRTLQCYATADLGNIAYETLGPDGNHNPGMVIDEDLIVEIVRPGTGDPLPDGEVGEVVVTTLNPDYPLIRFATGDLSAILEGQSPCGRTNRRIKGWMGRADQTTKVKGMFIHPGQVAAAVKPYENVLRARLVVSRAGDQDAMTLYCEAAERGEGLAEALAESLKEATKISGTVELQAPESLPNDGKIIDDQREYGQE